MKYLFLIASIMVTFSPFAHATRFSWACNSVETNGWVTTTHFASGLTQLQVSSVNNPITVNVSQNANGTTIFKSEGSPDATLFVSNSCVRVAGRPRSSIDPRPATIRCSAVFSSGGRQEKVACEPAE